MLVCRRWRAVVEANPCFWRSIHVGKDNLEWLNLALFRSADSNLFLDFSSSSAFFSALPQLLDRRDRIEHLRFSCYGAPSLGPMVPLVSVPLPSVTHLDVSIDTLEGVFNLELPEGQEPRHHDILEFKPVNFPRVTNLSLNGAQVSFSWTTSFISHLRFLDLRRCKFHPATSVGSFFDILREAQNLEELTLDDVLSSACSSLPRRSDGAWSPFPTSEKPTLRTMSRGSRYSRATSSSLRGAKSLSMVLSTMPLSQTIPIFPTFPCSRPTFVPSLSSNLPPAP